MIFMLLSLYDVALSSAETFLVTLIQNYVIKKAFQEQVFTWAIA